MKIIVFGATGTIGQELVKQALNKGFEVTAFVRSPEKLKSLTSEKLTFVQGNITNIDDVEKAIKHHKAVFCAIGDGKVGTIRTIGTKHIIKAMKKAGIQRLICQTTLGMGESYGNLNFVWKHIMFGILLKKAFQDHKQQEQYIIKSDLDYTIVRPSAFVNGNITNAYKVGFDGTYKNLSLKITRADVANFMLKQLHTNQYLKRAVSISN
ncbi:NAD(P)-dependent oxidoreductase [Tenacibaculum sp. SDUM215027]|uniref:NAD(P)-dependent oxidoreductase n=1 Tax=Tenacibaculum sp. SDUM215027 TaxID=3422596 RepID=UPI003D31FBBB